MYADDLIICAPIKNALGKMLRNGNKSWGTFLAKQGFTKKLQ